MVHPVATGRVPRRAGPRSGDAATGPYTEDQGRRPTLQVVHAPSTWHVVIDQWLEEALADESIDGRRVIAVGEREAPNDEVRAYLVRRLVNHRISLEVARDMVDILGWDAVERRLQATTIPVRRGDFGEMLATAVLETFDALLLPVSKVRYQMHADQTLVGADLVGLRISDGKVESLHFGEVKLRTAPDTVAGRDAHQQLERWLEEEFADIIMFFGQRLEELDDTVYSSYVEYLADGDHRDDNYHVVLVFESSAWSSTVVQNIPQPPDQLDPLTIRFARIERLADLVTETYARLQQEIESGS